MQHKFGINIQLFKNFSIHITEKQILIPIQQTIYIFNYTTFNVTSVIATECTFFLYNLCFLSTSG